MTPSSSTAIGPEAIKAARTSWRRSQIVESAVRLMEAQGFHEMSVSALARAAGISVGTIYQYVNSKEDILLLIIEDVLQAYAQEVPEAMSGIADPLERLAAGFLAYCHVVDRHQTATLLAYRESRSLSKPGLQTVINLEIETTGLLVTELRAALTAGILRSHDSELVGADLIILAHMWALKHWHFGDHLDAESYGRAQLAIVLGGLIEDGQRDRYPHLLVLPSRSDSRQPGAEAGAGHAGGQR